MNMTINNMARNKLDDSFRKMSTGLRINSAKDDAAGLAIAEKLNTQIRGLEQGIRNTEDMGSLLRTAEGGLSGVSDSLQRVRELSLQAANGILEPADKQLIQNEIDQVLGGIKDFAQNTEFNNMKLLDGSYKDKNTASGPDGTGLQVTIEDASLSNLGLENFSVTGDSIDLSALDSAMEKVNTSRSKIGAMSNRLESVISSNQTAYINQAESKSRISDLDVALESIRLNQEKAKQQYQTYSFKKQQEREKSKLNLIV